MRAVANTNLRTVANFEKLHSLLSGYLGLSLVVVLLWTDGIENTNDGQKQARFEAKLKKR